MRAFPFRSITAGLGLGLGLFLAGCSSEPEVNYDAFAQCLTEEGMVMYGAYWCPHCADQKALFGDSFEYATYVECDPKGENAQPELCLQKNIESYPTWIHSDGRRWQGTQTLAELATVSGCALPAGAETDAENEEEGSALDAADESGEPQDSEDSEGARLTEDSSLDPELDAR